MESTDAIQYGRLKPGPPLEIILTGKDPISLALMKIFISRFVENTKVTVFSRAELLTKISGLPGKYPDVLLVDCHMQGTMGMALIMAVTKYFRDKHAMRPPFRMVLSTDFQGFNTGFIDLVKNPGYLDQLVAQGSLQGFPENERPAIDALVAKPLNKEKISLIFNR